MRCPTTLLLSLLLTTTGIAQLPVASPSTQLFVSAGYWPAPSKLNDFYSAVLGYYQERGIPIPLQVRFAKTLSVEGGVLYSRIATIQIGLSFGFRFSPAYAGYQDFAGSLKISGSMYSYDISFVMRSHVMDLWGQPLIVSIEPGIVHASASITETATFTDRPQFNDHRMWTVSTWGAQFRFLMGTSFPVGPCIGNADAGYQKSVFSAKRGSAGNGGWMIPTVTPVGLEQEGPVFIVGIGYVI